MKKETTTFVGYKKISDYTVAEFKPSFLSFGTDGKIRKTFVLDKSSCKSRLESLRKGSHAHDQTALALEQWPAD